MKEDLETKAGHLLNEVVDATRLGLRTEATPAMIQASIKLLQHLGVDDIPTKGTKLGDFVEEAKATIYDFPVQKVN
ncbi:hypothetical protein [Iodobacter sp.]|uniref:hypothetical protein n=1 Tax=Iodobacter sp. TaxID=1915058 RepID=UPI0025E461DA|nr:hypothetical protein [Iodobacter sp.]